MESYRVYTVSAGAVEEGARIDEMEIKTAGKSIPAVLVGESGRGRSRGVLPVEGANAGERLLFAGVGQTKSGRPKLVARPRATTAVRAVVVLRTPIGYRGSNAHTGDEKADGSFEPFPGQILSKGIIAQGLAGRMGSGEQLVAVVECGAVFRTAYSGRMYGQPAEHFYMFDGERLLAATREERETLDLF